MEEFSSAVFGSRHRLPVLALAATAEPDNLYAQAIADQLGAREGSDKKELEGFARRLITALEKAELLAENPMPPSRQGKSGRPPRYLCRTEDEFWSCLQELGSRFRKPPR